MLQWLLMLTSNFLQMTITLHQIKLHYLTPTWRGLLTQQMAAFLLGKYETCLLGSCGFAQFLIVLSVRSRFARLWVCNKRRRKSAEKRPHYFSPSMETRCFLPYFSSSNVIFRAIEVEEFTASLMSWTCCRGEIKTCCLRKHVVWLLPVFAALNGLFV